MIAAFNIVIGLIVVNAPNRQSLEYDRKRKCDFVNISFPLSCTAYGYEVKEEMAYIWGNTAADDRRQQCCDMDR